MSFPCHLAVSSYDNVMIADWGNARVVLLSSSLTPLCNITTPKQLEPKLIRPYALLLDEQNHCLYIEEWTAKGRVVIFVIEYTSLNIKPVTSTITTPVTSTEATIAVTATLDTNEGKLVIFMICIIKIKTSCTYCTNLILHIALTILH